jgi:hypothetical protein
MIGVVYWKIYKHVFVDLCRLIDDFGIEIINSKVQNKHTLILDRNYRYSGDHGDGVASCCFLLEPMRAFSRGAAQLDRPCSTVVCNQCIRNAKCEAFCACVEPGAPGFAVKHVSA